MGKGVVRDDGEKGREGKGRRIERGRCSKVSPRACCTLGGIDGGAPPPPKCFSDIYAREGLERRGGGKA
jgi:hypothetical protein